MMKRARISFWLWIVLIAYLYLSIAGWVRLANSIIDWYWLGKVGITPGPLYLAITGGILGMVGAAGAAWVFLRAAAWRQVGMAVAVFYAAFYWIDRLVAARPGSNLPNTSFAVGLTILGLLYAGLVLGFGKK